MLAEPKEHSKRPCSGYINIKNIPIDVSTRSGVDDRDSTRFWNEMVDVVLMVDGDGGER